VVISRHVRAAHCTTHSPCSRRALHHAPAEHVQQLQLIQPVISLAVMALHRQNAEADCDIALVLDHHASEGGATPKPAYQRLPLNKKTQEIPRLAPKLRFEKRFAIE
jgi:hypothetical protein